MNNTLGKKFIHFVALFFLVFNQSFSLYAQIPLAPSYEAEQDQFVPSESVDEIAEGMEGSETSPETPQESFFTDSALSPAEESKGNEEYVTEVYETPREGLHEIQPGIPVAYLAERLTAEDLRQLRDQSSELGLLIAGDLVVAYSTGDEEFIRSLPPVENLVESDVVTLTAHFHHDGPPSATDLLRSGARREYVIGITEEGDEIVWGYEQGQIVETLTYEEFIARAESLRVQNERDPVEVRALLNDYIAAIDRYQEGEGEIILDPLLYAHNGAETTLPNRPFLGIWQSQPGVQLNSFNQTSSSQVLFNYDVRPTGSFAALAIQFDNLGTPGIETANLSVFDQVRFGIRSNNTCGSSSTCLQVEFEDIFGTKVRFRLRGISSTSVRHFSFARSTFQSQFPNFRLDQVRFINFVYDRTLTKASTRTGFLDLTTGGLFFEPHVVPGSGPVTDLTAFQPVGNAMEPAGHDTVTRFEQASATQFLFDFNLANGADNDFSRWGGAIVSLSPPFNLQAQDLVLNLQATGTTAMKIELVSGTGVNEKKVTLIADNLTPGPQFYRITKALVDLAGIQGFDPTDIRFLIFVVDDVRAGSKTAQGRVTVNTLGLVGVTLLPANPALAITPLPLVNPGIFTSGATSTVTPNVLSQTFMSPTYTGQNADSFGGVVYKYQNPINLNTLFPQGIVFQLDSPTLTSVGLEIKTAQGVWKARIEDLKNFGQKYLVSLAQISGIDLTQVTEILFVFSSQGTHTLNIDWGNYLFTPKILPANPALAITPLPLVNPGIFTSGATSTVTPNVLSQTFMSPTYTGQNADSFGGVVYKYQNPINLNTLFPQGIVFQLDSPTLTSVGLEIKTAQGVWKARIEDLKNFGQKYLVSLAQISGIDLTQVTEILFVFSSQGTHTLNIDWGNYLFTPVVNGAPLNEGLLTVLNGNPSIDSAGGNTVGGQPNGIVFLSRRGSDEFEMEFDLTPSPTSFVYSIISNGFFDDNGVFQGTPMALPENFIVAARGREGGEARVEVTDINQKKAVFVLNVRPVYQNYTLVLSGANVPSGFDRNNIGTIAFVEDQNLAAPILNDLVKFKVKGLNFSPPVLPDDLLEVRTSLVQKGLAYFQVGTGIDPTTHFPYDTLPATGPATEFNKYTQPTLIGFYLEILGQVVRGKLNNGMTRDQALAEVDAVVTSLLNVQQNFGWNGLIPWFDLDPVVDPADWIGLGDNANLAQSLAAMMGDLESSGGLTPAQQALMNSIVADAELFLDNQAPGFLAFADPVTGLFRASLDLITNQFNSYIDRLANEFRGAIAFLMVRFPALPDTVWTNLVVKKATYTDQFGNEIQNLAYVDGGAFQAFWPTLKNSERDFIGFRNALYNAYVSFTDYSAQFQLPGFVSASDRIEDGYNGRTGIFDISEIATLVPFDFLFDIASTYALASAFTTDAFSVLEWLNAIEDGVPALNGTYGFLDAARSNTEFASKFIGIDIASTVLGLSGSGAEGFERYLRNRGLELSHNLLYDALSQSLAIQKTTATAAEPPAEFPDRSLAVFSNFVSEGVVNGFPANPTSFTGVQFNYGALAGGLGGQFWDLDQIYDASENRLLLFYSITDSPDRIKIKFEDAGGNELFILDVDLDDTAGFHTLALDLPNLAALQTVARVVVVIDQNETGDTSGDFILHTLDFQHFAP